MSVGLHAVHGHRPTRSRLRDAARCFGLPRRLVLQRRVAHAGADPSGQCPGDAALSAGNPLVDQPPWGATAADDCDARARIEHALPDLRVSIRQTERPSTAAAAVLFAVVGKPIPAYLNRAGIAAGIVTMPQILARPGITGSLFVASAVALALVGTGLL